MEPELTDPTPSVSCVQQGKITGSEPWDRTIDVDAIREKLENLGPGAQEVKGLVVAVFMRAGYEIANLVGMFVAIWAGFLGGLAIGILAKIPKSEGVFQSLITAGYNGLAKKGDVVANMIYGDDVVVPRPAEWQSQESEFVTNHGEKISARGEGYAPKRINGEAPVVWSLRMSSEVTEPLEAVIANSRKRGKFVEFNGDDGQAEDVAVDVAPDGGREGMIVSFREGYELFGSKVDQEDMKDQEKRGKLSVLDRAGRDEIKVALMVLGGVALGLFGPSLAATIVGGGASGVGGGIGGAAKAFGVTVVPHLPAVLGVLV